jgi:starch synthase
VSRTYAKEILTPEYGAGLERTLQKRKGDLYGIVNGIDTARFNPRADAALEKPYTEETFEEGKAENKRTLQRAQGLKEDADAPLFGFVGRLTNQKGMDLIAAGVPRFLNEGAQVAILGTGAAEQEAHAKQLARDFPGRAAAAIAFDAALAQRIYAASDFFLMPSRFEPCGLGQLIALRYGAVPVVRATGGLIDTVPDYAENETSGLGFRFEDFSADAFQGALSKAVTLYRREHAAFRALQKRGMLQDVSWEHSAPEYATLYEKALLKRREE